MGMVNAAGSRESIVRTVLAAPLALTSSHQVKRVRQTLLTAYSRLSHEELSIFCSLRSLPVAGNLALTLANHDLNTYPPPSNILSFPSHHVPSPSQEESKVAPFKKGLDLPVEIIADIMDHLGDWELSTATGLPTSLTPPLEWNRATPLDNAILSGRLARVQAAAGVTKQFTKLGANAAIRFCFKDVLEYLKLHLPQTFYREYGSQGQAIPLKASQFDRVPMLDWWRHHKDFTKRCYPDIIDTASKAGAVNALEWWHQSSGLPMVYSEAALEGASLKGHTPVLNWWKASGLPLKIGKVLESASTSGKTQVLDWWAHSSLEQPKYEKQALILASTHGRVSVLQWWLESGLQMIYDADVLVGATKMNRPAVLDWWDKSGLPVPYRLCDIEEALEDAIDGGDNTRAWWKQKGVDFHAGDAEWSKIRTLN